jgi:hypothetical protein
LLVSFFFFLFSFKRKDSVPMNRWQALVEGIEAQYKWSVEITGRSTNDPETTDWSGRPWFTHMPSASSSLVFYKTIGFTPELDMALTSCSLLYERLHLFPEWKHASADLETDLTILDPRTMIALVDRYCRAAHVAFQSAQGLLRAMHAYYSDEMARVTLPRLVRAVQRMEQGRAPVFGVSQMTRHEVERLDAAAHQLADFLQLYAEQRDDLLGSLPLPEGVQVPWDVGSVEDIHTWVRTVMVQALLPSTADTYPLVTWAKGETALRAPADVLDMLHQAVDHWTVAHAPPQPTGPVPPTGVGTEPFFPEKSLPFSSDKPLPSKPIPLPPLLLPPVAIDAATAPMGEAAAAAGKRQKSNDERDRDDPVRRERWIRTKRGRLQRILQEPEEPPAPVPEERKAEPLHIPVVPASTLVVVTGTVPSDVDMPTTGPPPPRTVSQPPSSSGPLRPAPGAGPLVPPPGALGSDDDPLPADPQHTRVYWATKTKPLANRARRRREGRAGGCNWAYHYVVNTAWNELRGECPYMKGAFERYMESLPGVTRPTAWNRFLRQRYLELRGILKTYPDVHGCNACRHVRYMGPNDPLPAETQRIRDPSPEGRHPREAEHEREYRRRTQHDHHVEDDEKDFVDHQEHKDPLFDRSLLDLPDTMLQQRQRALDQGLIRVKPEPSPSPPTSLPGPSLPSGPSPLPPLPEHETYLNRNLVEWKPDPVLDQDALDTGLFHTMPPLEPDPSLPWKRLASREESKTPLLPPLPKEPQEEKTAGFLSRALATARRHLPSLKQGAKGVLLTTALVATVGVGLGLYRSYAMQRELESSATGIRHDPNVYDEYLDRFNRAAREAAHPPTIHSDFLRHFKEQAKEVAREAATQATAEPPTGVSAALESPTLPLPSSAAPLPSAVPSMPSATHSPPALPSTTPLPSAVPSMPSATHSPPALPSTTPLPSAAPSLPTPPPPSMSAVSTSPPAVSLPASPSASTESTFALAARTPLPRFSADSDNTLRATERALADPARNAHAAAVLDVPPPMPDTPVHIDRHVPAESLPRDRVLAEVPLEPHQAFVRVIHDRPVEWTRPTPHETPMGTIPLASAHDSYSPVVRDAPHAVPAASPVGTAAVVFANPAVTPGSAVSPVSSTMTRTTPVSPVPSPAPRVPPLPPVPSSRPLLAPPTRLVVPNPRLPPAFDAPPHIVPSVERTLATAQPHQLNPSGGPITVEELARNVTQLTFGPSLPPEEEHIAVTHATQLFETSLGLFNRTSLGRYNATPTLVHPSDIATMLNFSRTMATADAPQNGSVADVASLLTTVNSTLETLRPWARRAGRAVGLYGIGTRLAGLGSTEASWNLYTELAMMSINAFAWMLPQQQPEEKKDEEAEQEIDDALEEFVDDAGTEALSNGMASLRLQNLGERPTRMQRAMSALRVVGTRLVAATGSFPTWSGFRELIANLVRLVNLITPPTVVRALGRLLMAGGTWSVVDLIAFVGFGAVELFHWHRRNRNADTRQLTLVLHLLITIVLHSMGLLSTGVVSYYTTGMLSFLVFALRKAWDLCTAWRRGAREREEERDRQRHLAESKARVAAAAERIRREAEDRAERKEAEGERQRLEQERREREAQEERARRDREALEEEAERNRAAQELVEAIRKWMAEQPFATERLNDWSDRIQVPSVLVLYETLLRTKTLAVQGIMAQVQQIRQVNMEFIRQHQSLFDVRSWTTLVQIHSAPAPLAPTKDPPPDPRGSALALASRRTQELTYHTTWLTLRMHNLQLTQTLTFVAGKDNALTVLDWLDHRVDHALGNLLAPALTTPSVEVKRPEEAKASESKRPEDLTTKHQGSLDKAERLQKADDAGVHALRVYLKARLRNEPAALVPYVVFPLPRRVTTPLAPPKVPTDEKETEEPLRPLLEWMQRPSDPSQLVWAHDMVKPDALHLLTLAKHRLALSPLHWDVVQKSPLTVHPTLPGMQMAKFTMSFAGHLTLDAALHAKLEVPDEQKRSVVPRAAVATPFGGVVETQRESDILARREPWVVVTPSSPLLERMTVNYEWLEAIHVVNVPSKELRLDDQLLRPRSMALIVYESSEDRLHRALVHYGHATHVQDLDDMPASRLLTRYALQSDLATYSRDTSMLMPLAVPEEFALETSRCRTFVPWWLRVQLPVELDMDRVRAGHIRTAGALSVMDLVRLLRRALVWRTWLQFATIRVLVDDVSGDYVNTGSSLVRAEMQRLRKELTHAPPFMECYMETDPTDSLQSYLSNCLAVSLRITDAQVSPQERLQRAEMQLAQAMRAMVDKEWNMNVLGDLVLDMERDGQGMSFARMCLGNRRDAGTKGVHYEGGCPSDNAPALAWRAFVRRVVSYTTLRKLAWTVTEATKESPVTPERTLHTWVALAPNETWEDMVSDQVKQQRQTVDEVLQTTGIDLTVQGHTIVAPDTLWLGQPLPLLYVNHNAPCEVRQHTLWLHQQDEVANVLTDTLGVVALVVFRFGLSTLPTTTPATEDKLRLRLAHRTLVAHPAEEDSLPRMVQAAYWNRLSAAACRDEIYAFYVHELGSEPYHVLTQVVVRGTEGLP